MKEVICEALAPPAHSLMLIDPPFPVFRAVAQRETTISLLVVASTRRQARRYRDQILARGEKPPPISLIQSGVDSLPLHRPCFDAVVMTTGLPSGKDPVAIITSLRRYLRPSGAILLVSCLRSGPMGEVSSFLKRVVYKTPLPQATDLTKWMLIAGISNVRQARVPRAAVPTVLTWGEVRAKPWEKG